MVMLKITSMNQLLMVNLILNVIYYNFIMVHQLNHKLKILLFLVGQDMVMLPLLAKLAITKLELFNKILAPTKAVVQLILSYLKMEFGK